jgi:O-antigen ligase
LRRAVGFGSVVAQLAAKAQRLRNGPGEFGDGLVLAAADVQQRIIFPRYRPQELVSYFDYTHNDYAQVLVETGAVGTGILGLLVLATLFVALKTQYERADPLTRGVTFGVRMGIISLIIHSWVDFNLQITANALTFTVLLAMG